MILKKLVGAAAAASLTLSSAMAAAQVAPEPATEQVEAASETYGYGAIHVFGFIIVIGGIAYLIFKQLEDDTPESP